MKYIPQLDALRAIAVILVIISHWVPGNYLINKTPNGAIGVDIFFVLSGFLISKILFEHRNKAEQLNIPTSRLIKNFYIRRTLRIFPIYYFTIIALLLFSESIGTNIKSAFIYLATYTANIYFFTIQDWQGIISHLWSLAVEEQFYLIWPWIILFANKKYLLHIISAFILIGVLSQYLLSDVKMSYVLTFTCFDAFGVGSILAWITTYASKRLKSFYTILSVVAAVSFVLFVYGVFYQQWEIIPLRTLISAISLWLITYLIINSSTNTLEFKFIWNNRGLIFLGKISYGLYLYHNITPMLLNTRLVKNNILTLMPDWLNKNYGLQLYIVENAIVLILISWLSFIIVEKRFLNLKKYFELQKENRHKLMPQREIATYSS